jgi:hypothetical protein
MDAFSSPIGATFASGAVAASLQQLYLSSDKD